MPARDLPKPAVGDWGSGFGWRVLPDGTRNFHNGRDLTWFNRDPEGSQRVYSPVDGVAVVGKNSLIGNFVSLPIGDGHSTRLCHFASLTVTNGQQVKRGQYLGRMGNTGSQAFGVHLHVDVFNPSGVRVDPALYYTNTFVGTLTTAGGDTTPIGDDDMPLTDEELTKIADRVWTYRLGNKGGAKGAVFGRAADWLTNMSDLVQSVANVSSRVETAIQALPDAGLTDEQVAAVAASLREKIVIPSETDNAEALLKALKDAL